jgi:ATP-binding protein involved in chromosome partitioning
MGIRESGDSGEPVALDPGKPAGEAFRNLAHSVKEAVDRRNKEKPPTKKVNITTR